MSKNRDIHVDMTHGPLVGKILLFAFPLALSGILQQLFNSADAAVVGQFVSDDALAAVGANGSIIGLLVNLFTGLSVGANVVVSIFVGTENHEKAHEAAHTSLALSLICGFVLLVLGFFAAGPMLALIDTTDEVMSLAVIYLRIYFCGMPFSMFYNFGSAVLRSKGDTRWPLYALLVSTVVNLALNLLFVCVFGWGVAGVAVATVIANAVSASIVFAVLRHEGGDFRLEFRDLNLNRAHLAQIAKIGLPAGLQGVVFSLSNFCIQAAINSFGAGAMAGSSGALNYELFSYYLVNAFAQTAVTFTSQNYALRQYDRCDRVLKICFVGGIASAGASIAVFVGFANAFVGIFATEAAAIAYGVVRMVYVEAFEFLTTTYEVPAGAMRGMGHSMLPAIITLCGSCLLRFVWVYLVFPHFGSWQSLMLVYPVSWVVTGTVMLIAYTMVRKVSYGLEEKASRQESR